MRDHTSMPRWLIATLVLLCLSVFINYIDRGNLSTAAPLIKDDLNLSATQLGFLLTSFFITYDRTRGWKARRTNFCSQRKWYHA